MIEHVKETDGARPPDSEPPEQSQRPAGSSAKPWWRRAWMIPLVVLIGAFLIDELPPYLSLDPNKARIILNKNFPDVHYAILVAHIAAGTIALVCVCLQVWPWLRRHHPEVHRVSGRVYIFGGALPCALLALTLDPLTAGWEGNLGITVQALLLLTTTLIGYRMIRLRRYASHRRWMLYSFALVTGVLWGRAAVVLYLALPLDLRPNPGYIFEVARWFGWLANLALAKWWLDRTSKRPEPRPVRPQASRP